MENLNKENTVWYAVMKLSTEITLTEGSSGIERSSKIQGLAGFIPCFETIEEAYEASCEGKYQILAIRKSD
jgi:hypothetical protein